MRRNDLLTLEALRAELGNADLGKLKKDMVYLNYKIGLTNRIANPTGVAMDLFYDEAFLDRAASTLTGNAVPPVEPSGSILGAVYGLVGTGKITKYSQYANYTYDGWGGQYGAHWYSPSRGSIFSQNLRDGDATSGTNGTPGTGDHCIADFPVNGTTKANRRIVLPRNFSSDGAQFWDSTNEYWYTMSQTYAGYMNCASGAGSYNWAETNGTAPTSTWGGKLFPASPGSSSLCFLTSPGAGAALTQYNFTRGNAPSTAQSTYTIGSYYFGPVRMDHWDATRSGYWLCSGSASYNSKKQGSFFLATNGGLGVIYDPHVDFLPNSWDTFPYTYYNGYLYVFPNATITPLEGQKYVYVMNCANGVWTKRALPKWVHLYNVQCGDLCPLSTGASASRILLTPQVAGVSPTTKAALLYDLVNDKWDFLGLLDDPQTSAVTGPAVVSDGTNFYHSYGIGTAQNNRFHYKIEAVSAAQTVASKERVLENAVTTGKLFVTTSPLAGSDAVTVQYQVYQGSTWSAWKNLTRNSVIARTEMELDEHEYVISEGQSFIKIKFKVTLTPGTTTQFPRLGFYAFVY